MNNEVQNNVDSLINNLSKTNYSFDANILSKEEIKSDLDIFDLICHIAWDAPALTRKERAENVRKRNYRTKYGEQARSDLKALLDKYSESGIENIEDMKILTVEPLKNMGTPTEIVKIFGGKPQYLAALRELEAEIYRVA